MSTESDAKPLIPFDKNAAVELLLLSATALFFELLVIRWMSSDFMAFSVFKTFPLVTCYVGLGVGFAASSDKYFRYTPWALLSFVATAKLLEFFFKFSQWAFPSLSVFQWFKFEAFGSVLWAYVLIFIAALIVLLMGPFSVMSCLGTRLGSLFGRFKPLTAYGINLLGSIVGSILFSIFSFTGAAPWMLVALVILLLTVFCQQKLWLRLIPAIATVCLAAWIPNAAPDATIYWTPYQKLTVSNMTVSSPAAGSSAATNTAQSHSAATDSSASNSGKDDWQKNQGIVIGANGQFYQYALDLSEANLNRPDMPPAVKQRLEQHAHQYNLPYKLKQAKSVLILGAGSGNDVASALRHGAEHVDAVDIDPVIINLGKLKHPEKPYDSSKVTIFCDDARDYLNKCKSKYDLIIFAGLDSHTVTGKGSSVRLDNFVYTKESIEQALSLLDKDGLIVLSFCKSRAWLSRRLFETIQAAAQYPPVVLLDKSAPELSWEVFVTGPPVRDKRLVIPDTIAPFAMLEPEPTPFAHILTDDWPFVYVTPIGFDIPYLTVVGVILLLALFATRRLLAKAKEPELWQMFFLGAGFILLELQAIARLSLLFGSTWMTSSIVINSVLLMLFGANYLVSRLGDSLSSRQPILYCGIGLTLIASYLLPVHELLHLPDVTRNLVISTVTIAPVFMAGLIFPAAFRKVQDIQRAYAFNLLGAVAGALCEYASNYTGINSLVLIALGFYALSFVFLRLRKSA